MKRRPYKKEAIDHSEQVKKRQADMPKRYRKLYDRVMSGKAPPREAIKMQCLECWGWARTETQLCDNYACPLYRYRPYQDPSKSPREPLQPPNVVDIQRESS